MTLSIAFPTDRIVRLGLRSYLLATLLVTLVAADTTVDVFAPSMPPRLPQIVSAANASRRRPDRLRTRRLELRARRVTAPAAASGDAGAASSRG